MAITITQDITGIYPAYNNSYFKFTTGLTSPSYADITIAGGAYTNPFRIYPDTTGEFLFNFKDIIKAQFNADGFKDSFSDNGAANGKSIAQGYDTLDYSIIAYEVNAAGTIVDSEVYPFPSGTETLEFYKSAKQVGESVFANEAEVLAHSENGIDFYLTYFEGYPFTIDLKRLTATDSLVVKNLGTDVTAVPLIASTTDVFRLYIDNGGDNWTTNGFLPLVDVVNRLELKVNTVFKTNIYLKKVTGLENCDKGIFVKWFNNHGGYSYWLFDEFYTTKIKSKEKFQIASNDFGNVGALVNPILSGGYEAEERIIAKSQVDRNESKIVKDMLTSPSVQIWSAREPWQAATWIDCTVDGEYSVNTKKALNDISIVITLPELIIPNL